jgi:hypothetical protein
MAQRSVNGDRNAVEVAVILPPSGFKIEAVGCTGIPFANESCREKRRMDMTANGTAHENSAASLEPEVHALPRKTEEDNNAVADAGAGEEAFSSYSRSAWDWVCWSGAKTFDGMDFAGEVLANFLGLTQSKYQWILDAQAREEEEKEQRRLEKRQRRQLRLEQLLEAEQQKLQELEIGALEQDSKLIESPGTV